MADLGRVGSLEINTDDDFQRREWRAERVGWALMLLLVTAGVAGLFGGGPLSRARAGQAPLRLEYDRFARHGAPATLRVLLGPGAAPDSLAGLWLDRSYLERVELRAIVPEPAASGTAGDRVLYTFRVGDGDRPTVVSFLIAPDELWQNRGRLGLVGGPSVEFTQFVYP